MKKNMAVGDRLIRLVLAVVMIFLFFSNEYTLAFNAVLLTVSGIFILTAFSSRCPLYILLHIDTRQFRY